VGRSRECFDASRLLHLSSSTFDHSLITRLLSHRPQQLLFSNAYSYNEEGSWAYDAARALQDHLPSLWSTYIVGFGLPGAPPAPDVNNNGALKTSASKVDQRRIVLRRGGSSGEAPVAGPSSFASQSYSRSRSKKEDGQGLLWDGGY